MEPLIPLGRAPGAGEPPRYAETVTTSRAAPAAWPAPVALAAVALAGLLATSWAAYLHVPYSDPHDWIAGVFGAERTGDWLGCLWSPHNAQRIPVALGMQALDVEVARGRAPVFLLVAAAAWLLGVGAAAGLVWRSRLPGATRALLLAVAAALLLGMGLAEDFAFPVFSVYPLVAGPALASAAVLQSAPRQGLRSPWLWAALALAAVACGGNAAGLAIWPALFVGVLAQARGREQLAAVGAAGLFCLVVFEQGLGLPTGSGAAGATPLLAHLVKMAEYFAIFGGLPWTRTVSVVPAMALAGAAVWAAAAWAVARARPSEPDGASPLTAAGVTLIVFGLVVAVLATLGRVDENPRPLAATRYTPFAALLQLGVLLASARALASTPVRRLAAGALALIVLAAAWDVGDAAHLRRTAERIRAASAAFDRGEPDRGGFVMSPHPALAHAVRAELARRGLPS